jgi:hypothetical protein
MDLYMIGTLIVCFGLFYGFLAWCDRAVKQTGGDGE